MGKKKRKRKIVAVKPPAPPAPCASTTQEETLEVEDDVPLAHRSKHRHELVPSDGSAVDAVPRFVTGASASQGLIRLSRLFKR